MTNKKRNNWFMSIFDVLFIMILCFATLLSTMLMQGGVLVGSGGTAGIAYTFSYGSFALVVAGLAGYLFYIISHSDKELRSMIKQIYGERKK
jgi:hypothetical protein